METDKYGRNLHCKNEIEDWKTHAPANMQNSTPCLEDTRFLWALKLVQNLVLWKYFQ
jgi:hypothetical protein